MIRDRANIKSLTDYDSIGLHNFSLARTREDLHTMKWDKHRDDHADKLGDVEAKGAPPLPAPEAPNNDKSSTDQDDYLEAAIESFDTQVKELHLELSGRLNSIDGSVVFLT